MDKLFELDDRLLTCASLVRKGAKLADIGTDHAYLPVWLAKKGIIKSAVAADIRPLPLKSGRENIEKYGCTNIVSTRLSDGLEEIDSNEADDIVMAGMGAELICNIIDRTPWLKDSDKHLVLQPMTRAHVLRKYLSENGFYILEEKACVQSGKSYTVILSSFSGTEKKYDVSYYYIGKLSQNDPAAKEFMYQVLKKLMYKLRGQIHDNVDSREIENIIGAIKQEFGVDIDDNG